MAAVILMDARSIAATMRNGGRLTAATELELNVRPANYTFDPAIYAGQVYDNEGSPDSAVEPRMGPNIGKWPEMYPYKKHLLLQVAGVYAGSLTTDELVPSGEATAYRSNPEKISEYTLISKDEEYRARAKSVRREAERLRTGLPAQDPAIKAALEAVCRELACKPGDITLGSVIVSDQIGDGSSREQAASNQKILGGCANLAEEYSTKRYRSNCINWGILPLLVHHRPALKLGDFILISDVWEKVLRTDEPFELRILSGESCEATLGTMTEEEKHILLSGCLINYYKM